MNFNVHRRNKSLGIQPKTTQHRRQGRSLKKVQHLSLPDSLLLQAKTIYNSQGDLKQAVQLFQQFLALNPMNSEALYLCGVSLLRLGQAKQALERLQAVGDDYQNKPNAMLLSAMALNKLGLTSLSLEAVNQCIHRYSGFQEAICFRGKLYLSLKYYNRAEGDFKALAARPNSTFLCQHSLGDCYRSQGKPEKAIGPYLKALQLLQHSGEATNLMNQMRFKVGICLYQLERWAESYQYLQSSKDNSQGNCQLYYYLGGCQLKLGKRQEGLLLLEFCLRVQGNPQLMRKAYKKLLQAYLTNYQFYEAYNVAKLGDISCVKLQGWGQAVQAFMDIIKGDYRKGVQTLTQICNALKRQEQDKKIIKFNRQSSNPKYPRYQEQTDIRKGILLHSSGKIKEKVQKEKKDGKLRYFSTKSVAKAIPKIQSTRVRTKMMHNSHRDEQRIKTEHVERDKQADIYVGREKEIIYPLVLLFKAYGEFFQGIFFSCLDTYQEYQAYIKDVFGRQSDVLYNKNLCQGLLMAENDMQDEALNKYTGCLDLYIEKHGCIPPEPLLYKIALLVKLALGRENGESSSIDEQATYKQILESTIVMIDNYETVLGNHYLALYFKALICLLLDKLHQCNECLEKALKVAEDCSWKWLWVKGVIETTLGNYYSAVKEFSAGLILEARPQLYLGRSIAFLLLSQQKKQSTSISVKALAQSVSLKDQLQGQVVATQKDTKKMHKNQLLIENCFEDLQKFIELQNKQQDISLWVSKILFANGAYDEAVRSLNKIAEKTPQVAIMTESVAVYEGEFEEGGLMGLIIKSAFEGKYLTEQQEKNLQQGKSIEKVTQPELAGYHRWLVVLHLYVTEKYVLLLKYLQRQLFSCEEGSLEALLRYNVAIVYFILLQQGKAINVFRGIVGREDKYQLGALLKKIQGLKFDEDECIQDLREEIGINSAKLLSNYLPYRSVALTHSSHSVRIYVRPSIPFPSFPKPSLLLPITSAFILQEVNASAIQKKLDAPWIRRTQKKTVQFTQKLQQSGFDIEGGTTSLKQTLEQPYHEQQWT